MTEIPGQETDYERDEYKQDEKYKQEEDNDFRNENAEKRPDDFMNNEPNKSYENTTLNPILEPPEFNLVRKGVETGGGGETEEDLELSKAFAKYAININGEDFQFGIKKVNAPDLFKRTELQKLDPGSRNEYKMLLFDDVPIKKFKMDGETDMVELKSATRPKNTTYRMREHIKPKQEEFNKLFEKAAENYKQSSSGAVQEAAGIVLPQKVIQNVEDNVIDKLELKVDYRAFLKSVSEAIGKEQENPKQLIGELERRVNTSIDELKAEFKSGQILERLRQEIKEELKNKVGPQGKPGYSKELLQELDERMKSKFQEALKQIQEDFKDANNTRELVKRFDAIEKKLEGFAQKTLSKQSGVLTQQDIREIHGVETKLEKMLETMRVNKLDINNYYAKTYIDGEIRAMKVQGDGFKEKSNDPTKTEQEKKHTKHLKKLVEKKQIELEWSLKENQYTKRRVKQYGKKQKIILLLDFKILKNM